MELPSQKAKRKPTPGVDQFAHFQVYRKRDGSLSVLGQGAMGITYRARDTRLDRDVALKVISPYLVGNSKARDRFLRESKAAAALQHPHVAAILFQGEEGKTCFYAMELILGETLESYIARTGPLAPAAALELARQITGGLDAAHQRGLVHGDLTPGNLMLTSYERAGDLHLKIIDFGLARLAQEALPAHSEGIFGTPGYASPEHWENGLLDCRADIYSVGAILWFMVQGGPPFEGNAHSIVRRQASEPPPFDRLKNQPWSVRSLIEELMQAKPENRPKEPALVLERITQALLDLPEEDSPPRKLYLPTQVLHDFHEIAPAERSGSGGRFVYWLKLAGIVAALPLIGLGFVFLFVLALLIWIWNSPEPPKGPAPQANQVVLLERNGMAGRWASTSGSVIVIPDNPNDFILVVTHPDGLVFQLKAHWVPGKVGTQFTFTNEYEREVTATLDPQNRNRAKLTVEDRVYYWQRM